MIKQTSIVLVEPDYPTRRLYRRELSRTFIVFDFPDAHEVLELLAYKSIQLVILDPALDHGKGWDLLLAIQQHFPGGTLPIILCSTSDERRRGLENGIADYLVKPVIASALRERVEKVIQANSMVKPNNHQI